MRTLEFSYTTHYRDLDGQPAPLVPVRLHLGTTALDILALLDTGAEVSLFDGFVVREAGLDLFAGRPIQLSGLLGVTVVAYQHAARLEVAGGCLETLVAFSAGPLRRQVLGRDILSYMRAALDERATELHLDPVW